MLHPAQAKYFAYKLSNRQPTDSVEKLVNTMMDAQVDLNPHQVEAALFAFRSPLSKGAILADEVGLGKTIEAGLVIAQKWAERKRRILIITPANLRKQWNQELQDKFFLQTVILERKTFDDEISSGNLNPFNNERIVLCSYPFAMKKAPYLKATDWDLVVIDEAHRMRNVYRTDNKTGRAIREALNERPKVLLTATPLQNSILELYGLVSIIDDYAFGDLKSFRQRYSRLTDNDNSDLYGELKSRLQPLCKRTLRKDIQGQIKFTDRKAIVEEYFPSEDEQRLYTLVSEYLQRPNLYALPSSQRSLMTMILRKLLASSTFAISGTLSGLATKLDLIAKDTAARQDDDFLPADTIANYEQYEEQKDEWIDEDDEDEQENTSGRRVYTKEDIERMRQEERDLQEFESLAKSITINSKGEKLITALNKGFEAAGKARKKAIIFTESTRTQAYIKSILEQNGYCGQTVLFNGNNNDPESKRIYQDWLMKHEGTDMITGSKTADIRAALVEYFRDSATIMIATEAAAEGINLQFCSIVVNYDMPWNPQRIEQRIGRCHRYGQVHDVVVVNFLNKANEADVRVYQILEDKFKLFSGVFGVSDEVLGSIESGVDFEKRIARIYQECRTSEEINEAFNKLQDELKSSIQEDVIRSRQKLLDNFDQQVLDRVRIQTTDYLGMYENMLWDVTRFALQDFAEFSETDHSFVLHKNPFPDIQAHGGPYRIAPRQDSKRTEDGYNGNIWRPGHPLAEKIIGNCRDLNLNEKKLIFNYSGSSGKVALLENLIGTGGWMKVWHLAIDSLEGEDHLIAIGITDQGEMLDTEICEAMLRKPIEAEENSNGPERAKSEALDIEVIREKDAILLENENRNARFFEVEMEKLDNWAEDRKRSLETDLKAIDFEIKRKRAEARQKSSLLDKVNLQREVKNLEKSRNELRLNLYQSQDDVEKQKEDLLNRIQGRLQKQIRFAPILTIEWKII